MVRTQVFGRGAPRFLVYSDYATRVGATADDEEEATKKREALNLLKPADGYAVYRRKGA